MNPAAHSDRERRILSLWERAVCRGRWDRDDALLADAGRLPGLGDRNRELLAMRAALFGRNWLLRSDCPTCAAESEFPIDALGLAEALKRAPVDGSGGGTVEWNGRVIVVRAPTADDLRSIAAQDDIEDAAQALLATCIPPDMGAEPLSEEDIGLLERRIESLDPAAIVSFALACPACGHEWTSPLDVADALWTELKRAAERSFTDVDALARTYGWTEEQVIDLSPVRRAAYLQLVAAP
ncbi:MAG: hypothetical protein ABI454_10645 [Sphingomicrobium sp.]